MNTDRIEKKILLRASRKRVWRALADANEFGTWFGAKFDGPFTPGGRVHGVIMPTAVDPEVGKAQKPHEGTPFDLTIERMDPERALSFRWHPSAVEPGQDYTAEPTTLVTFELEESGDTVVLTVVESGFDNIPLARRAKAFHENEQGWNMMVNVIERYLVQSP